MFSLARTQLRNSASLCSYGNYKNFVHGQDRNRANIILQFLQVRKKKTTSSPGFLYQTDVSKDFTSKFQDTTDAKFPIQGHLR